MCIVRSYNLCYICSYVLVLFISYIFFSVCFLHFPLFFPAEYAWASVIVYVHVYSARLSIFLRATCFITRSTSAIYPSLFVYWLAVQFAISKRSFRNKFYSTELELISPGVVYSVNRQQYVNMGVLDVLMHVPPYNYNFRSIVVAFATCSDTRYQWAPLHVMWGRVTIRLFFWDRWVNLELNWIELNWTN